MKFKALAVGGMLATTAAAQAAAGPQHFAPQSNNPADLLVSSRLIPGGTRD